MDRDNFNKMIGETIELGDRLIFKQFVERDFSIFKQKVAEISRFGIQILRDKVQLKICQIVGTMQKTQMYRLRKDMC